MTIRHGNDDAHHDLTWLAGALARALFARAGAHEAVLSALERMAACDFSAPLQAVTPGYARPCRWLPEALVAALEPAEEVAMSLAASAEHLRWRQVTEEEVALATVLGADGPLACAAGRVEVLIAAPGATMRNLRPRDLLFVLAGEAQVGKEADAIRAVGAGEVAPAGSGNRADRQAERRLSITAMGERPLLGMLLSCGDAASETIFGKALHG